MEKVNNLFIKIGGAALLTAMLVAVANMILRPLGLPITGSFEIMGFASAVIAACGLASAQDKRSHIAVDILFRSFPKPLKRIFAATGYLMCSAFFALSAWRLVQMARNFMATGEVSETLRIPFYPVVAFVALGLLLLAITLLRDAILRKKW